MRRFKFGLEGLLKLRRTREGLLKKNLELAHTKKWRSQEQEKTLQTQIGSLMEEMRQKRAEGDLERQETYSQILEHLNGLLREIQLNLVAQQKAVEEQQGRLKLAMQQRKLIEKIKEKQYTGWRNSEVQTEGAVLDEINLQKASRYE